MQYDYKPVIIVCNNCFHQLDAWKGPDGLIKKKCPYCGAVSVTSKKNRRETLIRMRSPEGKEVIL